MRYFVLLIFPFLIGCLGDQANKFADKVEQTNESLNNIKESVPIMAEHLTKTNARIEKLETEIHSSNNATQNSISGVGANLGKIAEQVQGIGDIDARLKVVAKGIENLDIRMNTIVESKVDANAFVEIKELIKDLRLDLEATANAQVGFKNELNQKIDERTNEIKQSMTAGRDVITQNQQITQEWVDILKDQNELRIQEAKTQGRERVWYVAIPAVVLIVLSSGSAIILVSFIERSRERAEQRAKEAKNGGSYVQP